MRALNSSGAPMKLAIGVPLAALIRNATICVADRPKARENSSILSMCNAARSARIVTIASEMAWPALLPLASPNARIAATSATVDE